MGRTFVLVHGAWHGAWCWAPLLPELRKLGHEAIPIDLPCDDPAAGIESYTDVVVRTIEHQLPSDIVLVGHSLGGLTIAPVAARVPVSSMIFLCALIPVPGEPLLDRAQAAAALPPYFRRDALGRTVWTDSDAATRLLYADCEQETAVQAIARLRPQADTPMVEPSPLTRWPTVPSAAIVCRNDAVFPLEEARTHCRERLGIEPAELGGSHSPFLARPAELARRLVAASA